MKGSKSSKVGIEGSFIVECKYSRPSPWILLTNNSRSEGKPPPAIATENSNSKYVLNNISEISGLPSGGLFKGPPDHGYAVLTATFSGKEKNRREVAYGAVISVAKAAHARHRNNISISALMYKPLFRFTFPMALLDGKLFKAFLGEGNSLVVDEIKWGRLVVKNTDVNAEPTSVDIVTKDYLPDYIKNVEREFDQIIGACEQRSELYETPFLLLKQYLGQIETSKSQKGASDPSANS